MEALYDYIIIGSGIAGLYAALQAYEQDARVLLVTKGAIDESNTHYAQGGIAASIGPEDSPLSHWRDTVVAGAGLVDEEAAHVLTEGAADRIADLVRYGVPFDTTAGVITLGREAAHSLPRIVHAGGDATGAHIERTLAARVRQWDITVHEHTMAESILCDEGAVSGLDVLDGRTRRRARYRCQTLILATGGAGQLFRVSTNPPVATGDGVALAYRCGAEITDMEFFQFHPTALRFPGTRPFLISEAVRGEGGRLRNTHGELFMARYHPAEELAPRDVVARAIQTEMQRMHSDQVYLDLTHLPAAKIVSRFPQINRFCAQLGLDITREKIPVSPAAHYMMGGIRTNTWGETTIHGLYACGEVACTGVHGANRLASNSLLETIVFAKRILQRTLRQDATPLPPTPEAQPLPASIQSEDGSAPAELPSLSLAALQRLNWTCAGITRHGQGLSRACAILRWWERRLPTLQDRPSHELANLLLCSRLLTEAALQRTESRGAHYREDFPAPSEAWRRHLVFRSRPRPIP
jgi:L-aspartate oxidase